MPHNLLLTGPPRSGKTTVTERVVDRLRERGYDIGGVFSPERRTDGQRVGFAITDAMTGESATLAAVDRETGPAIGKYRVDVEGLESIVRTAMPAARRSADVIVVDEIAPMEVVSEAFVSEVRAALDSETPTLAAVHGASDRGFIGSVKSRSDAELVTVTPENRETLPDTATERLTGWLAA